MLKEEFSNGIKGAVKSYKLMYKTDKMSVLLHFPGALLRSVQPYLGLFVTGYILNGFVTGLGFAQLLRFALGFIAVRFLLEQLEGYLDKIQRVRSDNTIEKIYLGKSKKYMHVDYALLDGPAIHEINTRIQRDNNWGAGFYNMPWYLHSTLGNRFIAKHKKSGKQSITKKLHDKSPCKVCLLYGYILQGVYITDDKYKVARRIFLAWFESNRVLVTP
ncbi:MAG: hypothetical protein FWE90_02940 [Defluviitaleaceae bacterium]|nr:hypothetical protein [Defluviitaleaceae bacterium]